MGANEDENIKLIKQRKRKMNVKKKNLLKWQHMKNTSILPKDKGARRKDGLFVSG